jgi:hypothetical protein
MPRITPPIRLRPKEEQEPEVEKPVAPVIAQQIMAGRMEATKDKPFVEFMAPARTMLSKIVVFIEGACEEPLVLTASITTEKDGVESVLSKKTELKEGENELDVGQVIVLTGSRAVLSVNQNVILWYSFVYRVI